MQPNAIVLIMTRDRAIKLAVEALKAERHTHAPSANMLKLAGIDSPATRNAARRYDELTEAIDELQRPPEPVQTRML